jgi:hypothetical protein
MIDRALRAPQQAARSRLPSPPTQPIHVPERT